MAFNWQQALAGAAGGALSGAGTGALLGGPTAPVTAPVAALIGALLGLGTGGLAQGFGGGEEGGFKQTDITSPQQNNILDMLLQMGQQNLQNPTQGFQPIKQNALNTFFQDIVPGLQSQFSGSGSNNYSSGTIQSQLSSAGAGLAQRLAGLETEYGQRNQNNALNQLSLGLSPRNQTYYQQRQPGFGENLLMGSLQAAPAAIQGYQQNQKLEKLLGLLGNQGK